jgi:hypothetical protein
MTEGFGIGMGLTVLLAFLLCTCHAQNALDDVCREEHSTLKEYEKCIRETSYLTDIKYARKEKV